MYNYVKINMSNNNDKKINNDNRITDDETKILSEVTNNTINKSIHKPKHNNTFSDEIFVKSPPPPEILKYKKKKRKRDKLNDDDIKSNETIHDKADDNLFIFCSQQGWQPPPS